MPERDQRTEEATPRRREESRENGQVAYSGETLAAVGLCTGAAALAIGGGLLVGRPAALLGGLLERLGPLGTSELDAPAAAALLREACRGALPVLLVIVLPVLATSVVVGYGQVGFRVTPKAVALDPKKVDPVKGLKRLVGVRGLVRTLLAAAKVLAITASMGAVAWHELPRIARLGGGGVGPMLAGVGHVALRCAVAALVATLALALLDLFFQRRQHERDIRMTKQEVKEEHRITEGDPHVKSRIRSLQREVATRRMMADVPKATVVVTNPTHVAVALRYEEGSASAPLCVAKGKGEVARRIKEVAGESRVPCHEDVALARALHSRVEVGGEIPDEMFAAVAEVIAHVWRLRGLAGVAG